LPVEKGVIGTIPDPILNLMREETRRLESVTGLDLEDWNFE